MNCSIIFLWHSSKLRWRNNWGDNGGLTLSSGGSVGRQKGIFSAIFGVFEPSFGVNIFSIYFQFGDSGGKGGTDLVYRDVDVYAVSIDWAPSKRFSEALWQGEDILL